MSSREGTKEPYHHGHLREELIRRGLEALERQGVEALSLRALAEEAGVSKAAPYRHFRDKDLFLGSLADEGFRRLHAALKASADTGRGPAAGNPLGAMGRAYMAFAAANPSLYRLMNSSLVCRMPTDLIGWARKSLMLLADTVSASGRAGGADAGSPGVQPDLGAATAAWAYIHGLVLIRIDRLFPTDLPEPDWDRLAGTFPGVLEGKAGGPDA